MRVIPLFVATAAMALPFAPARAGAAEPVAYDTAIRCAAVDTILSSVLESSAGEAGGDDTDRQMAEHFDGMLRYWIAYAASLKSEDAVLASYSEMVTGLAEQLEAAQGEDVVKTVIGTDMARCGELEQDALMAEAPGD